MSVNNDPSVGHNPPAAAGPKDIEAAHPTSGTTERSRLVASAALSTTESEASSSLCGRLFQSVSNLTTKKKTLLAAAVILGLGGVAATIALCATSKNSKHPPSPSPCWKVPHNATEICNAMATVGADYLQWLVKEPGLAALESAQNGIRQLFCSGAKVIDPSTIAWAQNLLPQLSNAIANQTAIALTGAPYDPSNPAAHDSTPQRLYNLIYHSNVDFKETDNWFGMEDFWAPGWIQWAPQHIATQLMAQGATMGLKQFCDRMNFADIIFGNGTYTCVSKQFADYIPQFAQWCFWRQS